MDLFVMYIVLFDASRLCSVISIGNEDHIAAKQNTMTNVMHIVGVCY